MRGITPPQLTRRPLGCENSTAVFMNEIDQVVAEFGEWAKEYGLGPARAEVKTEALGVPHRPIGLPGGWQGVYCFRFGPSWLKVGKAGPKSGARWTSQHYKPTRARSTLAFSLLKYGHLATREDLRVPNLKMLLQRVGPAEISDWIKANTERVNILIRAEMGVGALTRLEAIGHRILDPVFEGKWKFGGPAAKQRGETK